MLKKEILHFHSNIFLNFYFLFHSTIILIFVFVFLLVSAKATLLWVVTGISA